MTLVVDAILVVGGVALGRWIVRRARAARRVAAGPAAASARPEVVRRELPASLPCRLGDVVVRLAGGDEAWLAGGLVLEEEHPVAAVFVAPEAGGDRALYVSEGAGATIAWLAPLAEGTIPPTREPPHAVEHEGARFERSRRLPMRASRVGSGAPWPGEQTIVAEYTGPGAERLLMVAGSEKLLAWRGVALGEGEYDVLPGSEATRGP